MRTVALPALAVGVALASITAWRVLFGALAIVDAPAPVASDAPAPAFPPSRSSVVTAPLVLDLGPTIALLDSALPMRFGDIERRLRIPGNGRMRVAFAARRTPFRVEVDDGQVTLSTVVEYEGRGWYNPPLLPTVSAACGTDGVPRPRVRARLYVQPEPQSDWHLRTRSRVEIRRYSDDARDACTVTAFHIDVTERIVESVEGMLRRRVRRIDAEIGRADLGARMAVVWEKMARPIGLPEGLTLELRPEGARLLDIGGDGDSLVARVQLVARPRIVSDTPEEHPVVLPALERDTALADGFLATVDAEIDMVTASDLLRTALVSRRIRAGSRFITVRDAQLLGIGGGRVALGVTLDGAIRGRVFLTGTPALDTVRRVVRVPDLDFDVGSADALTASVLALQGEAVRDFLRERAEIPYDDALERLREIAERAMNRDLTEGVSLSASLDEARGVAASATRTHLRVRAEARGTAGLRIERALPTGRQ
jgi:hypothetical protein